LGLTQGLGQGANIVGFPRKLQVAIQALGGLHRSIQGDFQVFKQSLGELQAGERATQSLQPGVEVLDCILNVFGGQELDSGE